MNNDTNLLLYAKSEELFFKIYKTLRNYPQAEKFALCADIKRDFSSLLRAISLGNSVKSKRVAYLQEADGHLVNLKTWFTIAKKQKYINIPFYEFIIESLSEIKRLLVGFIKSSTNPDYSSKFKKHSGKSE